MILRLWSRKGPLKIYKVFKSFVISDTLLCKSYYIYNFKTDLLLYVLFNHLITDFLHVIKQQSYMLYFYTKS